jgi:pyruvate formate lyase activating enzyme
MARLEKDLEALVTNVQGFSTEDGPGIRTTVFFKGCPLQCPWCHNPEGLSGKPELIFYREKCIACGECKKACPQGALVPGGPGFDQCENCFLCVEACPAAARQRMGEWWTVSRLADLVLRDRVYYETSGGGVTASGGEAMVWSDFLAAFFARLKAEGLHTALDTSGVIGGPALARVLEHTDLALVDLKIMDPDRHLEIIGVPLHGILEHIQEISAHGTPIIIRVPLVPGFTDHPDNLRAIADFALTLSTLETIELLPYHRLAEPKYRHLGLPYPLPGLQPPEDEIMDQAKDILTAAGLSAVIAGRE